MKVVDDIECTPIEAVIYAAAFVAGLRSIQSSSPAQAREAGFYNDDSRTRGCDAGSIQKARWAREDAENAVRWHREVAT